MLAAAGFPWVRTLFGAYRGTSMVDVDVGRERLGGEPWQDSDCPPQQLVQVLTCHSRDQKKKPPGRSYHHSTRRKSSGGSCGRGACIYTHFKLPDLKEVRVKDERKIMPQRSRRKMYLQKVAESC